MRNKKLKSDFFLFVLTISTFLPLIVSAQENSVQELAWLAGPWISQTESQPVEEYWTEPKIGIMLGISRTISKSGEVFFEYLRIVEGDGKPVYVASPGGRKETEFVMTKLGFNEVTFENPEHDFPQKIRYQLSESGKLIAGIYGMARGKVQSSTWEFELSK